MPIARWRQVRLGLVAGLLCLLAGTGPTLATEIEGADLDELARQTDGMAQSQANIIYKDYVS